MANAESDDIQSARARAEIEKIRAETRSLEKSGFWSIGTIAALIAGLSGVAAVITAVPTVIIQWQQKDLTIAEARVNAERAVNEANAAKNKAVEELQSARQQLDDVNEKKASAQGEVAKAQAESLRLQQSIAALKLEMAAADAQRLANDQKLAAQNAALAETLQKSQAALNQVADSSLPAEARVNIAKVADSLAATAQTAIDRSRLVYLQFQGSIERQTMRDLQAALVTAGYTVPGIERRSGSYSTEVRYFRPGDKDAANAVAGVVASFLSETCGLDKPVKARLGSGLSNASAIEIWISGNCPPAGPTPDPSP